MLNWIENEGRRQNFGVGNQSYIFCKYGVQINISNIFIWHPAHQYQIWEQTGVNSPHSLLQEICPSRKHSIENIMHNHLTRIKMAYFIRIIASKYPWAIQRYFLEECKFWGTELINKLNLLDLVWQISYPFNAQGGIFCLAFLRT